MIAAKNWGMARWRRPGETSRTDRLVGPVRVLRQIYFIKETAGQQVTGYQLYSYSLGT